MVKLRPLNFKNSRIALFFDTFNIFLKFFFEILNFDYKTLNFAITIANDHAQNT